MANIDQFPKSERPPFKRIWFWVTIIISFVFCILGFVFMIKSIIDYDNSYPYNNFPDDSIFNDFDDFYDIDADNDSNDYDDYGDYNYADD